MNVRKLMAKAAFLALPALFAACSDTSRPPAIRFRISNAPPVPRTMSQMAGEVRMSGISCPRAPARAARPVP